MRIPNVSREAVKRALAEFDADLREAADWRGWEDNEAQKFALVLDERRYPPKKIVSMASGLPVSEFSGGPQTNAYLTALGFEVVMVRGDSAPDTTLPQFEIGRVYDRWPDINDRYGGSRQSGISTSSRSPAIFLFTGETGEQYGYQDAFDDAGVFSYTGEGQIGDMQLTRGNLAIVEHGRHGKALHLFESLGKGKGQKYLGEFAYASHSLHRGPDREGKDRQIIVFHLVPVDLVPEVGEHAETAVQHDEEGGLVTLAEARRRALAAFQGVQGPPGKDARRTIYRRGQTVKDYVLLRAAGRCESCRAAAPFERRDGTPYLEPHHTTRLSDGGLDHPRFVAALCPTCHREIHYGRNGKAKNGELMSYLASIEALE
jgi:5-methylcytosine-specific restriction protein A